MPQGSDRNASNNLVELELINPFDIDPPPDRLLAGRLDKVLKSVGARGTISVRARMITAVANTKFRTTAGEPVSMVGLHGKDELLVCGPSWAIERLGMGESPDLDECLSEVRKMIVRIGHEQEDLAKIKTDFEEYQGIKDRYAALKGKPEFVARIGSYSQPAFRNQNLTCQQKEGLEREFMELEKISPDINRLVRSLQQFFNEEIAFVTEIFSESDIGDFVRQECEDLQELVEKARKIEADLAEDRKKWWYPWTEEWARDFRAIGYKSDGAHFTRYILDEERARDLERPRHLGYSPPAAQTIVAFLKRQRAYNS